MPGGTESLERKTRVSGKYMSQKCIHCVIAKNLACSEHPNLECGSVLVRNSVAVIFRHCCLPKSTRIESVVDICERIIFVW